MLSEGGRKFLGGGAGEDEMRELECFSGRGGVRRRRWRFAGGRRGGEGERRRRRSCAGEERRRRCSEAGVLFQLR